ncbi:histone family protein nucleoid-structuring protein H-NS [Leptothrix cholodnii SP-6]|uniref:Histone family protein nucleoid-structuring protein H-NS n=1 Tax=Leptothrix cholodnii (strain ATCC 51168 / LMG 8142 / SP-6) TaxID=395495 RepID=B1XWK6_LEPCP|nr:H-NS histone family protein [Leptothrix cholodnii]ACB35007.1 histone family protein nucleoid-structuring protein H-NS [Leptothrix cholodnii SP-6]
MAKSLAQVNAQIAKLQREADALKAKEVAGVVSRIKEAIAIYSLTSADLFDDAVAAVKPAARQKRTVAAAPVVGKKAPKAAAKKAESQIKYRDEAGHTWTGHGKRPNWFKAAIEAGKKPEDLAV